MKKLKYDYIDGFDTHYNKWIDEKHGKIISLTELLQQTDEITEIFNTYKLSISYQNLEVVMHVDNRVKEWLYSEDIASR